MFHGLSNEFPHFIYVISGRIRVAMDDGTEVELLSAVVRTRSGPGSDSVALNRLDFPDAGRHDWRSNPRSMLKY